MKSLLFALVLLFSSIINAQVIRMKSAKELNCSSDSVTFICENKPIISLNIKTPKGYSNKDKMQVIVKGDTFPATQLCMSDISVVCLDSIQTQSDTISLTVIAPLCEDLVLDSVVIKNSWITEITEELVGGTYNLGIKYSYDKPVIYLYADDTLNVDVKLDFKGTVDFTYPVYKEGWNVEVLPENKIQCEESKYNYLFWEGTLFQQSSEIDFANGFLVQSNDLLTFFESTLSDMGLNSIETQDFVTYWVPQMVKFDQVFIQFWTDKYEDIAKLHVSPEPDNSLRFFMVWTEIPVGVDLMPQKQVLPELKRDGFTLLEWGGAYVNNGYNLTEN